MMELLKKLAESNTINFIIMLGILAVIVIKMNFKASMDTSISNVAGIIKKSDDAKSESITKLEKSKAEIEKLPTDIENLKKEAKVKAAAFKKPSFIGGFHILSVVFDHGGQMNRRGAHSIPHSGQNGKSQSGKSCGNKQKEPLRGLRSSSDKTKHGKRDGP